MNVLDPIYLLNVALHAVVLSALATVVLALTRSLRNRTVVAVAGIIAAGVLPWLTALRPMEKPAAVVVHEADASPRETILPVWTVVKMKMPEAAVTPVVAPVETTATEVAPMEENKSVPTWKLPGWPGLFAWAWCAGVALCFLALAIRWLRVRGWRKKLAPVDGEYWSRIERHADNNMTPGIFLMDRSAASPCVTGFLKPRIVLPLFLLEKRSGEKLRWAVRHETGHWLNGDSRWMMVFCVIRALNWWNPLLAHLIAKWAEAREKACDLRAAGNPDERANYSEFLVAMARGISTGRPLTVTMAGRGATRIRKRLEYLLETREVVDRSVGKKGLALAFALFGVLAVFVSGMKVGADEIGKVKSDIASLAQDNEASITRSEEASPLLLDHVQVFKDTEHKDGQRVILTIPVRKTEGAKIDPALVSLAVHLFNRTEKGEIVELADGSWCKEEWMNPPLDWADGEERLRVTYTIPPGNPQVYRGYKVELRYDDEVLGTQELGSKKKASANRVGRLESPGPDDEKEDSLPETSRAPIPPDAAPAAAKEGPKPHVKTTVKFISMPANLDLKGMQVTRREVLQDLEVQALMRMFVQKVDTDLMVAPAVANLDGQKAVVSIIRTAGEAKMRPDGRPDPDVPFVGISFESHPKIHGDRVELKMSVDYRYIPGKHEALSDIGGHEGGILPPGTDLTKIKTLKQEKTTLLRTGETQWMEIATTEEGKILFMFTTATAIDGTGAELDSFRDGKRIIDDPRVKRGADDVGEPSPDPTFRGKLRLSGSVIELPAPGLAKLEEALAKTPEDPAVLNELALAREQTGEFEKATTHYEKIFRLGSLKAGKYFTTAAAKLRDGPGSGRMTPCDDAIVAMIRATPGAKERELEAVEIPLFERGTPWPEFPDLKVSAIASKDLSRITIARWSDRGEGERAETWESRPGGSQMSFRLAGDGKEGVNRLLLFRIEAAK